MTRRGIVIGLLIVLVLLFIIVIALAGVYNGAPH